MKKFFAILAIAFVFIACGHTPVEPVERIENDTVVVDSTEVPTDTVPVVPTDTVE